MANCPATAKRCAHRCSALLTLTDVDVAKEIEREQQQSERAQRILYTCNIFLVLSQEVRERERGQSAAGERAAK